MMSESIFNQNLSQDKEKFQRSKRCSFQSLEDSFVVITDKRKDESRLSNEAKISVSCFHDVDVMIFSFLSSTRSPLFLLLASWWCRSMKLLPWKTFEKRSNCADKILLLNNRESREWNRCCVEKTTFMWCTQDQKPVSRLPKFMILDWPTIVLFSFLFSTLNIVKV